MIQSIVGFRSSFPPEISLAIASFCPDSFFGMLGTLYALEYLSHTASIVYKAPDKRPRQVRFEGRNYVAATNDQESQLGEETSRDAHTHGVLIGIDHFGIRCIAKGGHLPPHLNTEGLWWITAQAWDNLAVGLITDVRLLPTPKPWRPRPGFYDSFLTRISCPRVSSFGLLRLTSLLTSTSNSAGNCTGGMTPACALAG